MDMDPKAFIRAEIECDQALKDMILQSNRIYIPEGFPPQAFIEVVRALRTDEQFTFVIPSHE